MEEQLKNNILINDYENSYKIHNEKYEFYTTAFDKLSKLKTSIEKFIEKKLDIAKFKGSFNFTTTIEDNYIPLIAILFEEMAFYLERSLTTVNDFLRNLTNVREAIKYSNKSFTDFFNIQNSLNSKLAELQALQTKYFNSAEKAESFTYEFLNKKIHNKETKVSDFEKKNKFQNICMEDKEKYTAKLSEVNDEIKNLNEKALVLFNLNKNIEICIYDNFSSALTTIYPFIYESAEGIEKKKELKQKIIEMTNKRKEIDFAQYKEKEKIDFIQYDTKMDFENCYDTAEMGVYIMVGEEMSKIIGDYINENLEEFKNKIELNIKVKNILNLDGKITENDEEYLLSLLDTDAGINLFVNNLNKLRTVGNLDKTKKFIEFIGKLFNKILDYERQNNDLKYVKSCILLSLTFYYLDLNNNKAYTSELITNNKLINSPNFWRSFFDYMFENELNRVNHKINKNSLLFTQMLSQIKNMKEFKIDDRIIIKIIDEFVKKYDYSETSNLAPLFIFINSDPNEIEKLRKEYLDNPDLEKQLYPEDTFEYNKKQEKEG